MAALKAPAGYEPPGGAVDEAFAGVVPEDLLDRNPWFEDDVAALPQQGPRIRGAGPDIVRDADGELLVLEDNVRTPTLMAFAVAARRLVAAALPGVPRPRPVAARERITGRRRVAAHERGPPPRRRRRRAARALLLR